MFELGEESCFRCVSPATELIFSSSGIYILLLRNPYSRTPDNMRFCSGIYILLLQVCILLL